MCGREPVAMTRMVDTLVMARAKHPGAKHSLDALCSRYGIDRSHRIKHGALLDAQLLSQLYVELSGGRQIGLGLLDTPAAPIVTEIFAEASDAPIVASVRSPRPHRASAAELERHEAFVATLVNPVWTTIGQAVDGSGGQA